MNDGYNPVLSTMGIITFRKKEPIAEGAIQFYRDAGPDHPAPSPRIALGFDVLEVRTEQQFAVATRRSGTELQEITAVMNVVSILALMFARSISNEPSLGSSP